jgi:glutamyl endopeptidase
MGKDVNTTANLGKRPIGFEPKPAADFPGVNPRWHAVEHARLAMAPWSSICAISIAQGGSIQLAGTGWLAGPETVITAAHVIAGVSRGNGDLGYEVKFPGMSAAITALDARFHEKYRGDVNSLFDPFDIAALRIAPPGLAALPIADNIPADAFVEVAGYPGSEHGILVTHDSRALRLNDGIVLHKADTKEGHSGAPVLITRGPGDSRAVIALHIHGFKANPDEVRFPEHNVALAIESELAAFVRAHLGAT